MIIYGITSTRTTADESVAPAALPQPAAEGHWAYRGPAVEAAAHMISSGRSSAAAFDLGGVLLTGGVLTAAGESAAFALLENRFGIPAGDAHDLWHELLVPSELGELPESDVWLALSRLSHGAEPDALRAAVLEMASPVEDSVAALTMLHERNWRTALATNHLASWVEAWRNRFDWFDELDVIIFSADLGLRKPDGRFFAEVRAQLQAASPWFIDDRTENVRAAQLAGFSGVWVAEDGAWVVEPGLDGGREAIRTPAVGD